MGALALLLALLVAVPSAHAIPRPPTQNGTCVEADGTFFEPQVIEELDGGGQRIRYRCGPIDVTPGQNRIEWPRIYPGTHWPSEDGWITRLKPDLVEADGTSLRSDHVMFHHAVWLNSSRRDGSPPPWLSGLPTGFFPQRFFGAGEEKTILELPEGHGYRFDASDNWTLNHMLHSLVSRSYQLYIQWTIDFYPDDSPAAQEMIEAEPLWMDVQNGSAYPVFDVFRGDGQKGKFTYPDDASPDPYSRELSPLNRWEVDDDGYLVWTAGHVHSGGLWTDLDLIRQGAAYGGPSCRTQAIRFGKRSRALAKLERKIRKARKRDAPRSVLTRLGRREIALIAAKTQAEDDLVTCRANQPRVNGNRVHLFRSNAEYFDRPGRKGTPTSWDMAMHTTTGQWRPQVRAGDTLEIDTEYETKLGSWYESMGINFLWMVKCDPEMEACGQNPYNVRQDDRKRLNHGALPENDYHGGAPVIGAPDPRDISANEVDAAQPLLIGDWTYESSDFMRNQVVAVRQGERLTFQLAQADVEDEIWHSLTSCEAPCNRSTGISYPLPDGRFRFDSGQLGTFQGSPAQGTLGRLTNGTVGRTSWQTPEDMPTGTYTFFCRIHPSMRGAIKVLPQN